MRYVVLARYGTTQNWNSGGEIGQMGQDEMRHNAKKIGKLGGTLCLYTSGGRLAHESMTMLAAALGTTFEVLEFLDKSDGLRLGFEKLIEFIDQHASCDIIVLMSESYLIPEQFPRYYGGKVLNVGIEYFTVWPGQAVVIDLQEKKARML